MPREKRNTPERGQRNKKRRMTDHQEPTDDNRSAVKEAEFLEQHKLKCFELCKSVLWAGIRNLDDFIFEKIGRPLTNHVYKCTWKHQRKPKREPNPVLVRIYGDMAREETFRAKNLLVFNILAERKLGPNCYGYTPEGRIEEFYTCENLRSVDLQCSLMSDLIAIKVAEIHKQDMPLTKEPTFLQDFCYPKIENIERWLEVVDPPEYILDIIENIRSFKLKEKLTRVINAIDTSMPEIVFSHNGLTEGDILYLTESEKTDSLAKLIVIDYEYCAYNYRGYDLSMLFIESCINYRDAYGPPGYVYDTHYPPKEKRMQFLRSYLRAKTGRCRQKELMALFEETELCALAVHIMWATWGIAQYINNMFTFIPFGYLEYANDHLIAYAEKAKRVFPANG